jgi:CRISPR-associated endonuclease Csn1
MSKKILGLDLGSNSIGWALLQAENDVPRKIIDLGCRIFTKAVEEKTPTPKNVNRRNKRLARRVVQRRARRKRRMLNYLVKLGLLPQDLQGHTQPEVVLNILGDPYELRARALDAPVNPHKLGRALLHLVQHRGFLSSRKTILGDMADDPDVLEVLAELEGEEDVSSERAKEETAFKKDISELRQAIQDAGCRTLGEYLAGFDRHECKRNRSREGGHLRTDRQMYRDELDLIWKQQRQHHKVLTDEAKEQIERIIFHQRPLKLRSDRIGRCSLEPGRKRANIARLECQRFRYLQDMNHLQYFSPYSEEWISPGEDDRRKLIELFERKPNPTFKTDVRKALGLDKGTEFNLDTDNKKLKGNITACKIRDVYPAWDEMDDAAQHALVEDLLTIKKKSVLKKRLIAHWDIDRKTAVDLCLLEFEPGHSNHSLKAISKMLPYLEQGQRYDEARVSAGYGYEQEIADPADRLGPPPETTNPIVQKALHELRKVINAIIAEYGKPDVIRIEMARDLEMNTKKYKAYVKQQAANTRANDEAVEKYREMGRKNPHLKLSDYPSRADKLRYRLWKDQDERCAYSNKAISLAVLFSAEVDIDHILPYSESLDDSYMNKVVCFASENRYKGQRTPVDAFGGNKGKWEQITQAISRWPKGLRSKRDRFYRTAAELQQRDFISSQLNDTRYISKVAQTYLAELGADITTSKGPTTAWARHQWGLNSLIGSGEEKERSDHRHHAIDAVVVACVDRRFYKTLVGIAKDLERKQSAINIKDIHFDPPWPGLREDLAERLDRVIVSHTPQTRLSGALHEETGVGYIEGVGTVYRVNLDGDFKATQLKKIVDDDVREIVTAHMARYGDDPRLAFAEGVKVLHKDGQTPIKRVRIVQSKTDRKKLEQSKFGVRNTEGKVFKWLAYGNLHHVEIVRDTGSGKYSGKFVTMMEAHHRAKGIGEPKQPIVQTDHGAGHEFVMALHINDLVSVERKGARFFYRVQKLDPSNKRVHLRLHSAATLDNPGETLLDRESTVPALMEAKIQKHQLNAIGKMASD